MATIIVRDMPEALHRRLKADAVQHHRSMNGEILAMLEREMGAAPAPALPPPVKGRLRVDGRWIAAVIREARDGQS